MVLITIPRRGTLHLRHLVLDLNGTLTLDGVLIDGVAERLDSLRDEYEIYLVTADMHGTAARLSDELGIVLKHVEAGEEAEGKMDVVTELGAETVVAIGAGVNDAHILKSAGVGIAVLGPEGLAASALCAADLVASSIIEALDLLIVPDRLIATLRG